MLTPAISAADPSTTQADQVYAALRADILSGRFLPGEKMRINELAVKFEVSLGAVREALSRLAAERMAVAAAQKGYRVAPVSAAELLDLTRTRVKIEQLCLSSAIQKIDVEWESGMVAAYHRLHRLPERDSNDPPRLSEAWSAAHTRFHAALVGACDSPWLLMIREMLYAQTERYRRLSVPLQMEDRDIDGEHKALLDAVIDRDDAAALRLIDEHLTRTANILVTSPVLRQQEDLDPNPILIDAALPNGDASGKRMLASSLKRVSLEGGGQRARTRGRR